MTDAPAKVAEAAPLDRSTYIGSSDAPKVAGLSPWGSPLSVWMEKVGLAESERPPSLRMWLGLKLEPIVLELYEARTGRLPAKVIHPESGEPVTDDGPPVLDREHPFLGAHPDYEGVQIKTTQYSRDWGDDGSIATVDDMTVPLWAFIERQHEMRVMGWDSVDVAVLIGHDDFRRIIVPRDDAVIERLVAAEVEIWEQVQRGEAPPESDAESRRAFLRARFPHPLEPARAATPEDIAVLSAWREAKAALRTAEEAESAAADAVKEIIGKAEGIIGEATWKGAVRRTLDTDIIRARLQEIGRADIIEEATKRTEYRTLRSTKQEA